MPTLKLEVREVWGNVRYYPACKVSDGLAKLAKQQCFTKGQLQVLKDTGFIVELSHKELST